ncbi:FAD/NAD(P)-binding domain-containing protein [Astrocystis sublimbata]|nr:FAD/NAD(P)-binding domain-containing protein [Astrocystis sublimbata]
MGVVFLVHRGTLITQAPRQAFMSHALHRPWSNMASGRRMASTVVQPSGGKERVVILGSGWAGYALARTLDPMKFERIIVSPRSYFVFTPLVASTAVGTLEFRAVTESVRRLNLDHYYQGWADDVDFSRKVVRVEAYTSGDIISRTTPQLLPLPAKSDIEKGPMFDLPYDKLVVAVGAYAQTFGIEGVKQHANFLRNVGDARRIRMKILQRFETASLPITSDEDRRKMLHFAIVGGGPTGIEFAAELHDLVRDDLSKTYPDMIDFVNITVYDVAPKVLPMFDQKLAQYAMDTFHRERIAVKTEHHLTRIRPDENCPGCFKLRFKEYGEDEEVGAGIVVWSTGLMQNPLIRKLGEKAQAEGQARVAGGTAVQLHMDKKSGGIVTDSRLRATTVLQTPAGHGDKQDASSVLPDVFSIGDCAVVAGERYPATAQVASQQATYLAKRLNKGDLETHPFRFRNWGVMTYVGRWKAIHQSSADEISGRAAWILWRTAYLTKSMSIRNKFMVPLYWLVSWLFGRDITRF